MKTIIITAVIALLAVFSQAQESVREISAGQTIEPYRVEVTFAKTVHILFPATVKYVDLGSTDLVAGKADGAENVLRIKSAVRGFPGETNFSVITSDGVFYAFNAVYSEAPGQLSIQMEDWLHKDPYSPFASKQMYVRLQELGDENPLTVNRIMYSIFKKDAKLIKNIGSMRFGVQFLLKGIYVQGDLFYLHTSIKNLSNVNFDIDRIRFRIADRKVAKRTALQETFIEPVRVYNEISTVSAREVVRNVYVFQKFTIPDDKVLVIDVFEKNGGRHQSIMVQNTDLIDARAVDELKIM